MHHPLTKLTILLGTLVVIFAGITPQTLPVAAFSPGIRMPAPDVNPPLVFSAGMEVKSLTVTQPLGSLTALAWNNLAIADRQPELLKELFIPSYAEPWANTRVANENANLLANSSLESNASPSEAEPLNMLFQNGKSHQATLVYCLTCHASPAVTYLVTTEVGNGHSIKPVGHSWIEVACTECHPSLVK